MKVSVFIITMALCITVHAQSKTSGKKTRTTTTKSTQQPNTPAILPRRTTVVVETPLPTAASPQGRSATKTAVQNQNGNTNATPGITNPGNVTTPGQNNTGAGSTGPVSNGSLPVGGTFTTPTGSGTGVINNSINGSTSGAVINSTPAGSFIQPGVAGGVGVGATGVSGTGIGATRNSIEAGGTGVGSNGSNIGVGTTGTATAGTALTGAGTTDLNNNPATSNPGTPIAATNNNSNRFAGVPDAVVSTFNLANAAAENITWSNSGGTWVARYMLGDTWLTSTYNPTGSRLDTRTELSLSNTSLIPPAVTNFSKRNPSIKLNRVIKIETAGAGERYELMAGNDNQLIIINSEGQVLK